jgi:hypothetical protein
MLPFCHLDLAVWIVADGAIFDKTRTQIVVIVHIYDMGYFKCPGK